MPTPPLLKGLGPVLEEFTLESIQADPSTSTLKKDFTALTSYNLLPKKDKTIIVPGAPPVLRPPTAPLKIKPDSGRYLLDPSGHVFPKCPLEPLFRALLISCPRLNMRDVDLVTDRRNLRLLLGFAGRKKAPFRIDIETVESTVLLSTWTPNKVSFVNGFQGFGHEFEKAATVKPDFTRGSIAYHGVVRYTLGPMRIIMRFEADACTQPPSGLLSNTRARPPTRTPTEFTVLNKGKPLSPSRIVEIKTGPAGKQLDSGTTLSQMWFSDTGILCTGNYKGQGIFPLPSVTNVKRRGKLRRWEEANTDQIRLLIGLLETLVRHLRDSLHKKVAVIHDGSGFLKLHALKNPDNKGIPSDLLSMWRGP